MPACRFLASTLTALLLLLCGDAHAARLALVVGNNDYRHVDKLRNATNDAALFAKTLAQAGFQVTEVHDQNRASLFAAIDTFERQINSGDEVVFFFAGHGVQIGSDPILLGTDIRADDEKMAQREGIQLLYVQNAMAKARLALLVIDACRDNPFPKVGGTRSIGEGRGLAPPEPAKGQAIIMSAGRGQKALDAVPNVAGSRNGLFTVTFAEALREPGQDLRTALLRTRDLVEDQAAKINHPQRPSLVDDLRGNVVFFPQQQATLPPVKGPDADMSCTETMATALRSNESGKLFLGNKLFVQAAEHFERAAKEAEVVTGKFCDGELKLRAQEFRVRALLDAHNARQCSPGLDAAAQADRVARAGKRGPEIEQAGRQWQQLAMACRGDLQEQAKASLAAMQDLLKSAQVGVNAVQARAGSETVRDPGTGKASELRSAESPKPKPAVPAAASAPKSEVAKAAPVHVDVAIRDMRVSGLLVAEEVDKMIVYSGEGKITWAVGDVYEGTIVRGKRHGAGRFTWANGQFYEGTWVHDVATGKGKLRMSSGDLFEGDVVDGRPEGQGRMLYASGDRYEGQIVQGEPHGKGVYDWVSGQRYTGPWIKGAATGVGEQKFANGNVYRGEVVGGQPHGQGRMTFANGDIYEGGFVAGLPEGQGTQVWSNGDRYVGAWKSGRRSGQGVMHWKSGDRWEGIFLDDQQTQSGTLTRASAKAS